MKKRAFLISLCLIFAAEIAALFIFAGQDLEYAQNAVEINEALQSVRADFHAMENHQNQTGLDYSVIDADGTVLFQTRDGVSESVHEAVLHGDTVLDVEDKGGTAGKLIIYSDRAGILQEKKRAAVLFLSVAVFAQFMVCAVYGLYLNHAVIRPFHKLKGFAERVAGGNLDTPLEMDRKNLFGAFTESFDIMRDELRRAQIAEAKANADKKELVAKLSHDIKTPVASIKAASEVGAALAKSERAKANYTQIIQKADQINTLVTNLFSAALEDMERLSVTPSDVESGEVKAMIENADYLRRAGACGIPDCLLRADKLRLQQVFDNIFSNSYKYADTKIKVTACRDKTRLAVSVEDEGGGVSETELPLLKEKFKRGSNAKHIEGAGLGLYISDYFMKEMQGELVIENGERGLRATVFIPLAGAI